MVMAMGKRIYDNNIYSQKIKEITPSIQFVDNYTTYKDLLKHYCSVCGGEFYAAPSNILKGRACPYCHNKKVLIGHNDMWTTHPDICALLVNPDDGYKYVYGTNKKLKFKCTSCHYIYPSKPANVKHLNCCTKCSDSISYPEKFMISVLDQLGVKYIYQLTKFKQAWCEKYRYDFYFENNGKKIIVETNGIQHYEKSFSTEVGKSVKDIQENDKKKRELALKHIDKYVEIDCRKSEYKYIVENIVRSELSQFFNLSKVDFVKCQEFAVSSLIVNTSLDYESGMSFKDIMLKYQISYSGLRHYLLEGNILGLCSYKPINKKTVYGKRVISLNSNIIYDSIIEASRQTGVSQGGIKASCVERRKVKTDKPFDSWLFYDDYLKIINSKYINEEVT